MGIQHWDTQVSAGRQALSTSKAVLHLPRRVCLRRSRSQHQLATGVAAVSEAPGYEVPPATSSRAKTPPIGTFPDHPRRPRSGPTRRPPLRAPAGIPPQPPADWTPNPLSTPSKSVMVSTPCRADSRSSTAMGRHTHHREIPARRRCWSDLVLRRSEAGAGRSSPIVDRDRALSASQASFGLPADAEDRGPGPRRADFEPRSEPTTQVRPPTRADPLPVSPRYEGRTRPATGQVGRWPPRQTASRPPPPGTLTSIGGPTGFAAPASVFRRG